MKKFLFTALLLAAFCQPRMQSPTQLLKEEEFQIYMGALKKFTEWVKKVAHRAGKQSVEGTRAGKTYAHADYIDLIEDSLLEEIGELQVCRYASSAQ